MFSFCKKHDITYERAEDKNICAYIYTYHYSCVVADVSLNKQFILDCSDLLASFDR